ncbi:hypothetical protein OOU_Y34scaffold00526g34 [Pyricularia oryzae Y34]|uniref:Uncharacterized protein n=2 Tax=Pyricularia oryzae TaxID=318829 RepID=A0AA97PL84_PYRO3|nr:hypothetical protein OOU_Y34scaffold00526g34 [Pyricularia oryzae Y34]
MYEVCNWYKREDHIMCARQSLSLI